MNLTLPQLIAGATGAVLIYSAVKGVSPVQVLKNGLTGVSPSDSAAQAAQAAKTKEAVNAIASGKPIPGSNYHGETPNYGNPIGLPPIPGEPGTYTNSPYRVPYTNKATL